MADDRVAHYCAVLQSGPFLDEDLRSDDHIWTNFTPFLNDTAGIHHHVPYVRARRGDGIEFQVGSLSQQIIFGLADVKPKMILERQAEQSSFLGHLREDLLLNHAKTLWYAVKYRDIEQVHSRIDLIADEIGGFFDKGSDPALWLCHHHSESAGILHGCEYDRPLG